MRLKTYISLTTWIFAIVGTLHLYRAFTEKPVVLVGWHVPLYISWLGVVVGYYLAYQGYKHTR